MYARLPLQTRVCTPYKVKMGKLTAYACGLHAMAVGLAAPRPGSRGDGTSHLLVLQQLDVQIFFGRPRRAGAVAQPCGGKVERGLTVRERAHHTRAPPDLAQDALERVVGANPPPVLLREGVVGECFLDRRFHQLGGAAQAQATQLLDHSDGLLACCREVLAGVDRLEHGCDLPHLVEGTWLKMLRYQCTTHLCQAASRKNSAALSASPMQAS